MRLLFIGDIVARSGRDVIEQNLPALRAKLGLDAVIANGENSAHGSGHTQKICQDLYSWGVDVITSGNHVWGQREIIPYLDRDPRLIRPINFPVGTPGRGYTIVDVPGDRKLLVINAMGRQYMEALDDPFTITASLLDKYPLGRAGGISAIFVDFHAEATSEKQAFARYLDGRVSAVIGTHTHVPTADHMILPKGSGYQSDAGMTGDYNSVLGRSVDAAIFKFVRKMRGEQLSPTDGPAMLCGTFMEISDQTGMCTRIEPVRLGHGLSPTIPSV